MNIKYTLKDKITICKTCGKTFIDDPKAKRIYCSKSCYALNTLHLSYKLTKKALSKLSINYLIWFTGFWEGEGSLYETTGCNIRKVWHFTITQKDKSLLSYLKNKIPRGYLTHNRRDSGVFNLDFSGEGNCLAFIESINPYIKLKHRKNQIKRFYNSKVTKQLIKVIGKK